MLVLVFRIWKILGAKSKIRPWWEMENDQSPKMTRFQGITWQLGDVSPTVSPFSQILHCFGSLQDPTCILQSAILSDPADLAQKIYHYWQKEHGKYVGCSLPAFHWGISRIGEDVQPPEKIILARSNSSCDKVTVCERRNWFCWFCCFFFVISDFNISVRKMHYTRKFHLHFSPK